MGLFVRPSARHIIIAVLYHLDFLVVLLSSHQSVGQFAMNVDFLFWDVVILEVLCDSLKWRLLNFQYLLKIAKIERSDTCDIVDCSDDLASELCILAPVLFNHPRLLSCWARSS